jgi:hypothetical protein
MGSTFIRPSVRAVFAGAAVYRPEEDVDGVTGRVSLRCFHRNDLMSI